MENQFTNSSDSLENTTNQMTPKFSDSSNSEEVLVFTSFSNVYKVPRSEIYNIHQVLDKVNLEEGEKAIYITGDKNYSGFLIVAFENGKIGKIAMKSFSTEFKRKKLLKAFNNESRLIFIERIDNDVDLVAMSNIKKVVLFNTSLINPVESRTTKGVQVMKQKDGSSMITVKRAEQANLTDPGYYRKSEGLNVVGYYLKKGDEV
jgi:DNA gyrase/topoisomerase IV subunit A